jgi:hypothetical protein
MIKGCDRIMTEREKLLSLGMKEDELDNHCSDLYVLINPISEKWLETYEYRQNVTKFMSQIDNRLWYNVPFAYHEYYTKRRNDNDINGFFN